MQRCRGWFFFCFSSDRTGKFLSLSDLCGKFRSLWAKNALRVLWAAPAKKTLKYVIGQAKSLFLTDETPLKHGNRCFK